MKRIIYAVVLAVGVAQFASAETWYWSPTDGNTWVNANNWTNTAATRGYPHAGDTAVLGWGTAGSGAYNVCNSDATSPLYEVRFEGNKTIGMNQGNVVLQGGGGGLKWMHNASVTGNWMGLYAVGDGEVPIHVDKNVTYALQMRMQKQGSGNPTIVKTGPGKFVCHNQGSGQAYTIPLTLIREGAYDITSSGTLNGVDLAFDGDDTSQRITYCYGDYNYDLMLKNIGFYETNGVNNTAHGFSSGLDHQVKFTGTPKQNPTVFSGTFYYKAGLNWAPDSASYTFVCSNAVSDTTGSLIIGKGTVKLVTGASFTALKLLSVAAGAIFEVEEGSGGSFHADSMSLGDATAQLKLGTGVSLDIGAGSLKGSALPHGTYSADGANDTRRAAWIDGAGTVTIVNGPDNIDTWSGAGADNLTSTDLNWASEAAPDVTAGDLLATFATGGTEASLPAGTAAAFDGLVLDSASLGGNAFSFTAGSGATATIGASGISVPASSAATTWTMGWPFTVVGGAQAWTVGAKNTLKLNAPWGGDKALSITGGGAVELNATSTHSGALTLEQIAVKATADNALGSASRAVNYYHDRTSLTFDGNITIASPLYGTYLSGSTTSAGGLNVAAGASVTFNGLVRDYNSMWVNVGAGATATFQGGLGVSTDAMSGFLYLSGGGTLVVTNTRMSVGQRLQTVSGSTVTLDLCVEDNRLMDRYWAEYKSGAILTHVTNAFSGGTSLYLGATTTLDLCGKNQWFNRLHGAAGASVKSDEPATLTILGDGTTVDTGESYGTDATRANSTAFSGQVSVTKQGSVQHTLAAVSSSTGTLKVTNGTLTMGAAASWVNCTNVVVAGGTFAVKNAGAFGVPAQGERPKLFVDVAASGATLNLDYTGRIECKEIHLDGVKQYGTFGATGSGAENEVSWITGTGTIRALPNGTVFSLR